MKQVVLISCSKTQEQGENIQVEELYSSDLFKKSLRFAREVLCPDEIFALSSKEHLLNLSDELDYYDWDIKKMSKNDKQIWAEKVFQQLKERVDLNNTRVIFLAGNDYTEFLADKIPNYRILMPNLRIGEKLEWLNQFK